MQERLPAMAPKKKARSHPTLTTTVLNSTSQVSKLIRALDPQELADVSGTDLALASLKNKLSRLCTNRTTSKRRTAWRRDTISYSRPSIRAKMENAAVDSFADTDGRL